MPMLISTPEAWMREQQRDLYLIQFKVGEEDIFGHSKKKKQGRNTLEKAEADLRAWFAEHLPNVPLQEFGPSEYSGFLCGGPRYLGADFTPEALAIFESQQETPEGQSVDPRWQCYVMPFARWIEKLDGFPLLKADELPTEFNARWFDTSEGILLLGQNAAEHIPAERDGWFQLQRLFPSLKGLGLDSIAHGTCMINSNRAFINKDWATMQDLDFDLDLTQLPEIIRLLSFLNLPADLPRTITFYEP